MAEDRRDTEKVVVDREKNGSGGLVAVVVGLIILVVVVLLLMGVFGGDDTPNDTTPEPVPTQEGDLDIDIEAPDTVVPEDGNDTEEFETENETTE